MLELSNLNTDRALADAQVVLGSGKSPVSDDRQKNTEQADVSIRNFRNSRSRSTHTLKIINVYIHTPIFVDVSRCLSVLETADAPWEKLTDVARENFTYTDFAEGYRDFEEVMVNGYTLAQGAFQALGYVYLNLDPNLSPVEEANCAYLMQRAGQMLFGVVGALREEQRAPLVMVQVGAVVDY